MLTVLKQWGAKRSGHALTVTGIDRETGDEVKLWPVDLVWAEEGQVFASVQGEAIAELEV